VYAELVESLLGLFMFFNVVKGVRKRHRKGAERAQKGRKEGAETYICLALILHERSGFRALQGGTEELFQLMYSY
jgi:hypothetical protein